MVTAQMAGQTMRTAPGKAPIQIALLPHQFSKSWQKLVTFNASAEGKFFSRQTQNVYL